MLLRVGHLSTFYHTAPILASDKNISDKLGAETSWQMYGTGPAIVEALKQDKLDLAYIGLPPALVGIDKGVQIKCIAGGHIEGTIITGINELKSYPELGTLNEVVEQFRDNHIGVPGKGSIHDVILTHCLEEAGLSDDVWVTNFRWADEIIEEMARGNISAAFGTPALAVATNRYSGGKLIYPPELLWPWNPSYGIVAGKAVMDQHPELIEKFLGIHEQASELLRNNPEEAAGIIANFVGVVDSDYVLETINISPKYCAQLTNEYINSTLDFGRAMKKLGYLTKELAIDDIFDPAFISKVHPPGNHYT